MKTYARGIAIALLSLCLVPGAFAQEEGLVVERWPNALGASFTSAYGFSGGISYQRWFDSLGLSFTAGVFSDPAAGNLFEYMAYGGLQYRVYAEDFAEWLSGGLYLAGNFGAHGSIRAADSWDEPGVNVRYGGGLGVGYELVLARHFSQMSEVLYVAQMRNAAFETLGLQYVGAFRYRY